MEPDLRRGTPRDVTDSSGVARLQSEQSSPAQVGLVGTGETQRGLGEEFTIENKCLITRIQYSIFKLTLAIHRTLCQLLLRYKRYHCRQAQ